MRSLNQYILEYLPISKLDKSQIREYHPTTKDELIEIIEKELDIQGPDADLNCINTSDITDMSQLFKGLFDHDYDIRNIDISEWDVSNVEDMYEMFYYCENFNSDLSKWDVSKVKDMGCMFTGCKKFTSDLSSWDVSKVEQMDYTFEKCENFNSDLSAWDVSNVEYMTGMFRQCKNFNSDLSSWNVSNVDTTSMFAGCASLKNKPYWYK